MKSKWFYTFQQYVSSGAYQQFLRDLEKTKTSKEIDDINRSIREVYVEYLTNDPTFVELGNLSIDEDGITVSADDTSKIKEVIPTFTRLMVGNHGVYVEFSEPIDKGEYIQTNKDYVWYEKDLMKFYKQTKTVNYADYKIGMWYVSIYDVFDVEHPKF